MWCLWKNSWCWILLQRKQGTQPRPPLPQGKLSRNSCMICTWTILWWSVHWSRILWQSLRGGFNNRDSDGGPLDLHGFFCISVLLIYLKGRVFCSSESDCEVVNSTTISSWNWPQWNCPHWKFKVRTSSQLIVETNITKSVVDGNTTQSINAWVDADCEGLCFFLVMNRSKVPFCV